MNHRLTLEERAQMRAIRSKYEGQSTAPSMLFDTIEALLDELDEQEADDELAFEHANEVIGKLQTDLDERDKPCCCPIGSNILMISNIRDVIWRYSFVDVQIKFCPACGHPVKE